MKFTVKNTILILIFSLLLLFGCGSDTSEVENAIDEANYLLNDRSCLAAREVLDEAGYQNNNPRYLAAYATTYACEAGYSTIDFFANDLDNLSATSNGFFGSLASFSTSNTMTSAADTDFTKLRQAVNTILYAGGATTSSALARKNTFGTRDGNNLNVQALYMNLVALGRWLRYHGNTNASGEKGAGTNPEANTCLYPYGAAFDSLLDDGDTGSCTNVAKTATDDTTIATLCNGIVLFNNFFDIIINISFSGTNTGSLNDLGQTFQDVCDDLPAQYQSFCQLRDQATCEAQDVDELQGYSILVFEKTF